MELISFSVPKSLKTLTIAPLGDLQWSGHKGPTAKDSLKRHIDECLKAGAFFVGLGDYIDFLSPSNRRRLINADLYDAAQEVIAEKAAELTLEVFEEFLKDTKGRWLGMVEGHHFYQAEGTTSDESLAGMLGTTFLGTSAFIKIPSFDVTLYVHHGTGGGVLPGSGLNRMYHTAAGLQGADIYLMGHNTKLTTARLSRPYPRWDTKPPRLEHRDIWIVNTGGFCRSSIVGHRHGSIPRGDYGEQAMYSPSPLTAPIIRITKEPRDIRVSI
jgi:hypothetical protein